MKRAKITVNKSGSAITIDVHNRGTELAKIYKADFHNTPFSLLDEGFQDSFSDTEDGPARYKGQIVEAESKEVINTSTEIINSSTEFIYKETPGTISPAKYLK